MWNEVQWIKIPDMELRDKQILMVIWAVGLRISAWNRNCRRMRA